MSSSCRVSQGVYGHLQSFEWHPTHARSGLSRDSWMATAGNQCRATLYKCPQGVSDEDGHCHPWILAVLPGTAGNVTESRFITPHFAVPKSYFSLAMLSGSLRTFPFVPDCQWSLLSGLSAANPCRRYLTTVCESGQSSLETMPSFPGKLRAGLGHVLHCHPSQDPVLSCICILVLPWRGLSLALPVWWCSDKILLTSLWPTPSGWQCPFVLSQSF